MAISVVMPALELAQETGKLVSWRKKEGEAVKKGEILLEVETDKAVVEVEATGDGTLASVTAKEGDVIPVGKTIAWLVMPGEKPPAESSAAPVASSSARASTAEKQPPAAAAAAAPHAARTEQAIRISPKARRLAREKGIDLNSIRGTGPGGEILASDVMAIAESAAPAAAAAAPSPAAGDLEPLSSIGRLMAERMVQSWTTVPQFCVVRELDATPLVEMRDELTKAVESAGGVRLTYTDLLVALVSRALLKHPRMNASWAGNGIRLHKEVNMGLAMAMKDGVIAAVIPKANTISLGEIATQRKDLAERARAGRSRPSDLADATFTISNLGMYHVNSFNAIVNPPQAGILAVGGIVDRVVPVNGQPAIRPMMTLTLSSDHRVVDGARAAMFMDELAEMVREARKFLK